MTTGQFKDASQPDDIQLLLSRVRMEYARRRQRERNLRRLWVVTVLLALIAAGVLFCDCTGIF